VVAPRDAIQQSQTQRTTHIIGSQISHVAPNTVTPDPAYRIKLMECIINAWPMSSFSHDAMDECSQDGQLELLDASLVKMRREVLQWVYVSSKGETWSIKRQGLMIFSSVISKWEDISQEELGKSITFIAESYNSNSVHNQVRQAALFCLRRVAEESSVSSGVLELLKGPFSHDVRVLLLQAQTDDAPGVLDELRRIRAIWKSEFKVAA
jgi:hypothetical protein